MTVEAAAVLARHLSNRAQAIYLLLIHNYILSNLTIAMHSSMYCKYGIKNLLLILCIIRVHVSYLVFLP